MKLLEQIRINVEEIQRCRVGQADDLHVAKQQEEIVQLGGLQAQLTLVSTVSITFPSRITFPSGITSRYDRVVSFRKNVRDFFHGVAYGAYERELRRQAAELNDLFLLLCYMEIVGLPNPATLYLLDVYPYLLEQFHQWHRRMGMDRSPLGTLPCC